MTTEKHFLVVVCGPTAVGKTGVAISLAQAFKTEIVSADARQFYSELKIGTAPPSEVELKMVRHHLVGHLSIMDPYNIGMFEKESLGILDNIFQRSDVAVMVGGSGLYIHAICHGIDQLPDHDPGIRRDLNLLLKTSGAEPLQEKLKILDPDYYHKVDLNNPARLIRAIEISMVSGRPYSSFRKGSPQKRPFRIVKIGLDLPRKELYERINIRVDKMISDGLAGEAESMIPFRSLNALNTVAYRELFDYFDGKLSLEQAISLIKQHTRNYAKRQLTWFRKDKEITWFHPADIDGITDYCLRWR